MTVPAAAAADDFGGSRTSGTAGRTWTVRSLFELFLVDRLRLAMFPLVLGPDGREPWFAGYPRAGLDLMASAVLDGRISLLEYRPVPGL